MSETYTVIRLPRTEGRGISGRCYTDKVTADGPREAAMRAPGGAEEGDTVLVVNERATFTYGYRMTQPPAPLLTAERI